MNIVNEGLADIAKAAPAGDAPAAINDNFDSLPDDANVRLPVVKRLAGDVDNSTIWRWTKKGLFPAAKKLGPNVTGWRVGDLRKWLSERQAAA